MSAVANVVNGEIVNNGITNDTKTEVKKEHSSNLDKDAFLQLLVTQMKYQDPLEPTSNTEYISQLATFSSLEEMQNMSSSMEMSRASALVGQYVFMNVTDSDGKTTYPEGTVDYVVYQNGKTMLSINETLYNMDDLDTVADPGYLLATKVNQGFADGLNKLPKVESITEHSKTALATIADLIKVYDTMTDYQKTFISKENRERFLSYVEKYKGICKEEEADKTDKTEKPQEADTVE